MQSGPLQLEQKEKQLGGRACVLVEERRLRPRLLVEGRGVAMALAVAAACCDGGADERRGWHAVRRSRLGFCGCLALSQ